MTTRHEFLTQLHKLLKPKTYLEIGVQHGWSLDLAHAAEVAIGVDPQPLVPEKGNQAIYPISSDDFFGDLGPQIPPIDFAFIDGMHLFEYALRDFMGVLPYLHSRSVVVFDDVLPRNQEEAARIQCPGDWTGDVWKLGATLPKYRPDLIFHLANTTPTGTMVVYGFGRTKYQFVQGSLDRVYESLVHTWSGDRPVPHDVINRTYAWDPDRILEGLRNAMATDDV